MVNQWSELGRYLVSPEEFMGMGDCRRFRDCPVRFAADRLGRVAKRLAETQAASAAKTLLWLVISISAAIGLGQLH